ncbi:MAG: hypothetical protein AAF694_05570 [Bacteroidota bacterium]
MNKYQNTLRLSVHGIFVLAALVILIDFIIPGKVVNDEIIEVKSERQQYYNAARNSHYSYKVITRKHHFFVAEDFAKLVQGHEKIEYSVSRVFKEVNGYRLLPSGNRRVYSLRIVSGLVLPLLTIISILVAYQYKKNIGTLVFVLKALLIVDLIFLIF